MPAVKLYLLEVHDASPDHGGQAPRRLESPGLSDMPGTRSQPDYQLCVFGVQILGMQQRQAPDSSKCQNLAAPHLLASPLKQPQNNHPKIRKPDSTNAPLTSGSTNLAKFYVVHTIHMAVAQTKGTKMGCPGKWKPGPEPA